MKVQIFSNKGYTNSYAKIINFYYYHFASFQSDTCPNSHALKEAIFAFMQKGLTYSEIVKKIGLKVVWL